MKNPFIFCFLLLTSYSLFSQNDIKAIVKDGIELHDNGKYQEAIKKFEEAAKIDAKSTLVNYEMANTYIALADYKKAIKFADKVIDVNDKYVGDAYMLKGTALDMSGKPKEAIKVYKKGIQVNPQSYLLNFNLGVTLAKEKEYKEAEAAYLNAIRLKPSHASSHLQLGNTGMFLDSKSKALFGYYFYLLLNPNNKFSQLAYSQIQEIMPTDASKMKAKDTPNTFNISLPSAGDIETTTLDLLISILPLGESMAKDSINATISQAKNAEDSAAIHDVMNQLANQNPFVVFAKRNESLFKTLDELNEKNDTKHSFWWQFYAPFFAELHKKGHTEAFSFYISLPSKDKYVTDWLKENSNKMKEFSDWISTYSFPK